MTHLTIGWKFGCNVIWICCGIVFIEVTADTRCWYPGISGGMTANAAYPDVTVCQREGCGRIVIKGGWRPGSCCMTGLAVGRELGKGMIWICRCIKVC